jgi:hypothetical protein
MLADALDLLGVIAARDTALRTPYEYDRPRYAEATPQASDMSEVASFFGMRYVPDQEETVE